MSVDLIILSGFLGSGKTTLLVDYLRQDQAGETGVIVNEAGEIGIDGAIVADTGSQAPMLMLSNGCVCCSLRSGLVDTVTALLDAPRPSGRGPLRRIVLETSGLSRPGPIIASLADPVLAAFQPRLAVVSTYDCLAGAHERHFDEAAAQLAAAHRIVLTKTDLVEPQALQAQQRRAAAFNPLAEVVGGAGRAGMLRQVFEGVAGEPAAGLAAQALAASAAAAQRHPRISVLAGQARAPVAWDDVAQWLDDLAGYCGERLLRVKALLRVTDCAEPILVQGVGTTYGVPRRMARLADAQEAVVVIARDIDPAELAAALGPGAPVALAPAGATPPALAGFRQYS